MTTFNCRISDDLNEAIERRAKTVEVSKNAWIEKSMRWVIHNLPHGLSAEERLAAVQAAPFEVTGTLAENMGLNEPDGRRVAPPDGHWHRRKAKPTLTYDDKSERYDCLFEDCTWWVVVDRYGNVLTFRGEVPESEVEKTRRLHAKNKAAHDRKQESLQVSHRPETK